MIKEAVENVERSYEIWKVNKQTLEQNVETTEKVLLQITGSTNGGLLTDEIRTSSSYISAKKKFNAAFKDLQDFNKNSPRIFLKKERAEHRNKRSY